MATWTTRSPSEGLHAFLLAVPAHPGRAPVRPFGLLAWGPSVAAGPSDHRASQAAPRRYGRSATSAVSFAYWGSVVRSRPEGVQCAAERADATRAPAGPRVRYPGAYPRRFCRSLARPTFSAKSLMLLVPGERIELPTNGLQNRCSTAELTRLNWVSCTPILKLPPDCHREYLEFVLSLCAPWRERPPDLGGSGMQINLGDPKPPETGAGF